MLINVAPTLTLSDVVTWCESCIERSTYESLSRHQENRLKTSPPNRRGHMGLSTCRNARTKLVSRCKLYGAYLTGDAELYDTYLTYHTGKVRQVSGSVVCMR